VGVGAGDLTFALPAATVTEIAERAAVLVLAQLQRTGSPWMTRKEAAEYLRLPLSRLEKDRSVPCHRDGGRVLYNRHELDEHFLRLGPCGT
jgi:excisionase family DNA binding protein